MIYKFFYYINIGYLDGIEEVVVFVEEGLDKY